MFTTPDVSIEIVVAGIKRSAPLFGGISNFVGHEESYHRLNKTFKDPADGTPRFYSPPLGPTYIKNTSSTTYPVMYQEPPLLLPGSLRGQWIAK